MRITVISRWFNEAALAPYFLNHYSQFADKIIIYLDTATTDNSAEIILRYAKAEIKPCTSPGGLNDRYLVELFNGIASKIDADWVISADADEYIFPKDGGDVHKALTDSGGNLIYAHFWQVYRHIDDGELDPNLPTIWQRRHGNPNRTEGVNGLYRKPIIFKPEIKIKWLPGQHHYQPNRKIAVSKTDFDGAHWNLADLDIAIERRIKGRRERFSEENKAHGWGSRWFHITEEAIRAEYEAHLHDPELF